MHKIGLVASMLMVVALVAFAEDDKKKEFKQTCPVSGKPALEDKTADYKGAKVYFCCENCPKAFAKDTAKYAEKANAQLVATGQFKQIKCPLTGRDLNPDAKVEVAGATVTLCCNNCKGKVTAAKEEEQLKLLFADKAFEKGFEIVKKEKKDGK
jgi:YHS domain-containing protein